VEAAQCARRACAEPWLHCNTVYIALPKGLTPKGELFKRELLAHSDVGNAMMLERDPRALAARLVEQMGDAAPRHAKCRLVELTAANELLAAAFWRSVMYRCEEILAVRYVPPSTVKSLLTGDSLQAGD
jgi:hypothetical protein